MYYTWGLPEVCWGADLFILRLVGLPWTLWTETKSYLTLLDKLLIYRHKLHTLYSLKLLTMYYGIPFSIILLSPMVQKKYLH